MAAFLTRTFFEQELRRLMEAYGREMGDKRVAVMVMLRDGQALKLVGAPTCTDDYVLCDFKVKGADARAAVPYGSVVAVTLVTESAGTMGFNR